jgi:hypothetical protein
MTWWGIGVGCLGENETRATVRPSTNPSCSGPVNESHDLRLREIDLDGHDARGLVREISGRPSRLFYRLETEWISF